MCGLACRSPMAATGQPRGVAFHERHARLRSADAGPACRNSCRDGGLEPTPRAQRLTTPCYSPNEMFLINVVDGPQVIAEIRIGYQLPWHPEVAALAVRSFAAPIWAPAVGDLTPALPATALVVIVIANDADGVTAFNLA